MYWKHSNSTIQLYDPTFISIYTSVQYISIAVSNIALHRVPDSAVKPNYMILY